MSEWDKTTDLHDALAEAGDLAMRGKRVAVLLNGAPEHMRNADEHFADLREAVGAKIAITMPPLTWCCYLGFREAADGEYDEDAAVELMTPRQYERVWADSGFDEVIRADFPMP